VTIAFDAWKEGHVAPTTHEVAVVAPKTEVKLEAVSARLKGELVHPDKAGSLTGLRFSPDGRRLVAGDYPGSVVVLWDVASGERLSTIETGSNPRGPEYFFLSPDWKTLYVAREKRDATPVEQDGKRLLRWKFESDVRAWDLASGQLRRTYKHQPAHGVVLMRLSPDGTTFFTLEELPGLTEGGAKRAASLWDVQSGQSRQLVDGQSLGTYSPDSQTLVLTAEDKDYYTTALKLLDTATGRERLSIPVTDKYAQVAVKTFSPDGRLMVGNSTVYEQAKKWDRSQSWLTWWDAATGKELASLAGEKEEYFFGHNFAPDGRTLAAVNLGSETRKLLLFRSSDRKLIHTVTLGRQAHGERLIAREPAFSPDGRWLAVVTQTFPDIPGGGEVSALDVAQPRIHLIDVASGTIREMLIAPQGFAMSVCFSPDGHTLATGGDSRVLLWDLTSPPLP
jgi:WD40 repeat protein